MPAGDLAKGKVEVDVSFNVGFLRQDMRGVGKSGFLRLFITACTVWRNSLASEISRLLPGS
jgi:hypothetical protein